MNAQVAKSKENSFPKKSQESRAVANSFTQKKSNGKQGLRFVDNRAITTMQNSIQMMIDNFQKQGNVQKSSALNNIIQKSSVIDSRSSTEDDFTDAKKISTKNYGNQWYQYEYDSVGNIDASFSDNEISQGNYDGSKVTAGVDPVVENDIDIENHGSGLGLMKSGKSVQISTSSRSRHFSIADAIIDQSPSDRKSKYTWHHLTPEYYMELVDMNVHKSFGHAGGKSFWT